MTDLPVPRLRRLFEAAELAVGTLDAEGTIQTVTTAFAEHWESRADDLVGRHLVGLWPEHRRAEITAVLVRLVEGASDVETVDDRSLDESGRLVVTRTTVGRLSDASGRTSALLCTLSDVSDSPRLERRSGATVELVSVLHCRVTPLGDTAAHGEAVEQLGERFRQLVRPGDRVRAAGGNDFLVFAQDLGDEQDAAGVAYRLLAAAMEPVITSSGPVMLGLTVGVAVGDAPDPSGRLLGAAASALGAALADGIGGFRLVDTRSGLAA